MRRLLRCPRSTAAIFRRGQRHVRYYSNSDAKADISALPIRANCRRVKRRECCDLRLSRAELKEGNHQQHRNRNGSAAARFKADGPPPPMPAPEPDRAPLQVIDGNYERMSGVCPWWDAVKRASTPI
jgi:hypothetical protein